MTNRSSGGALDRWTSRTGSRRSIQELYAYQCTRGQCFPTTRNTGTRYPYAPLRDHILNNTWPTLKQITDFGDNWHKLPLKKCSTFLI
ncbi:unnamed protein product [Pieris brassicae]|uniref:Uncharacterized protein n=1 Tax=Pieris brassicae TaxID=7116 RepID=A0A9P0TUX7_PIEBR|nr:unnamed protein product [Pieris brassicae]